MENQFVNLEWMGPFRPSKNDLEPIGDWMCEESRDEFCKVKGESGVYLICVDHPIHGPQSLAYIGQSEDIGRRITEHDGWLRDEWDVSIFIAACSKPNLDRVEALLIYAHSPIYNARSVSQAPGLERDLHVRNSGRFRNLFPDVCSSHPWNKQ